MISKNIFVPFFIVIPLLILTPVNAYSQNDYKKLEDVKGLAVGQKIPTIEALNQFNQVVRLNDLLSEGPLVIVFYRGFWCPLCNKHLSDLQQSLEELKTKGVNIVAVSPERPEYLIQTLENTGAQFTLLYDEDYEISNAFNLSFQPDQATIDMLGEMLSVDLTKYHSDESQRLPVPATYIINSDGMVVWRQFDPDYRKRSEISEIIKNIPQ
ncbi:MAG: AhpC/TSA family protein [Saprospirales bacterium]|nr:MAG: AhpC/TSA family protein [Saprospirales bacterium]